MLRRDKYILVGHTPVPKANVSVWADWFETADRQVARTDIGRTCVSTVFLGLDHNFCDDGPPLLFETMVFGGEHDQYQERYSTWDEAVNGHDRIVKNVMPWYVRLKRALTGRRD